MEPFNPPGVYRLMSFDRVKRFTHAIVDFSEEEWREKELRMQVRKVKKNEYVLSEGEVCRSMSFINSGIFRVFSMVKGKEITTNFFFEGSYLSDYMSFIKQQPSGEYIQALADSEIVTTSYQGIQEIYERYPNWQKFGRLVAEKVFTSMYKRQQDFLFYSPTERYLKLMEKRPKVLLHIPQVYIASYLGITPEYLSRIRRELREMNPES